MDVQQLTLVGRIVQDGEVITSKNDSKFAVFTVAANRYMGQDKESETTYYDCLYFKPNAEKLVEKLKKGAKVFLMGRPSAEAYVNKESEPVGKLKVVADNVSVS